MIWCELKIKAQVQVQAWTLIWTFFKAHAKIWSDLRTQDQLWSAIQLCFYQPRSGRSTFDVGQKRKKRKKVMLAFYCHFCLCAWNIFNWSHYMGVYGLAWTPAIIFETIWTPGPNFGSMGPLSPNLKIAIFSQNLTIWVSMDLPRPQHSFSS